MKRYGLTLSCATVLALLLTGLHVVLPDSSYELSGQVFDQDSGDPLADAQLTILHAATREVLADGIVTDAGGRYAVTLNVSVANELAPDLPLQYRVEAVYPNPVVSPDHPVRIRYVTPGNRPETPRLELYDTLGRTVSPEGALASGVYFYRLQFEDGTRSKARSLVLSTSGPVTFEMEQIQPPPQASAKRAAPATALEVVCIVSRSGYATYEGRITLQSGTANGHDFTLSADGDNLVVGEPILIGDVVVPAGSGGTLTVNAPETSIDGLAIELPAGAYDEDRTFEISYAEIQGHRFGEPFHPISPLISIKNGGGYADEVLTVTIPVTVPDDHFAMAVLYNEQTGEVEGMPLLELTESSVTVWTRHFATSSLTSEETGKQHDLSSVGNMVVVSLKESALANQQVIDTGFRPGADDWEFINFGSYIAPGGHCAGQSITALWYYYEKKLAGGSSLHEQYDQTSALWQDNPLGYRFASIVQEDLRWDGWLFDKLLSLEIDPKYHSLGWKAFATSMLLTGNPQFVGLSRQQTDGGWVGHAIVAHKISLTEGKLYVSDPNYPGQERVIEFANEQFTPYSTKQNASEPDAKGYTGVGYYATSSMIDWDKVTARWKEFQDGTIGTQAPNTFPDYTLYRVVDGEREPLPDAFDTAVDSVIIELKCTACDQKLSGTDGLQVLEVYDEEGTLLAKSSSATNGQAVVKLKSGTQRLGLYVTGATGGRAKYVDFKWVTVNRQGTMAIYPDLWGGEWAPIFNYGAPGQEYLLFAIHMETAPPDGRFTWDFGDGTDPVTVVGDSTVIHAFPDVGEYTVTMTLSDAAGTTIGQATGVAHIRYFADNFRMSRFEQTGQTGSFDEPSVAHTASILATMASQPSALVLDFAYWEDGEINAYLSFVPSGGDSEVLGIASNAPGPANDLTSFITIDDNQFSGRYVSGAVGHEKLAFQWIDLTMTQNQTTITGTLTLYGRRYTQGSDGNLQLVSEGSVTYTFEAESFSHSFGKRLATSVPDKPKLFFPME
jgi:hypothetical protein